MTRSTCVCCSITSETSTRYGSRVRRQGRSRRWARYQASRRCWRSANCLSSLGCAAGVAAVVVASIGTILTNEAGRHGAAPADSGHEKGGAEHPRLSGCVQESDRPACRLLAVGTLALLLGQRRNLHRQAEEVDEPLGVRLIIHVVGPEGGEALVVQAVGRLATRRDDIPLVQLQAHLAGHRQI